MHDKTRTKKIWKQHLTLYKIQLKCVWCWKKKQYKYQKLYAHTVLMFDFVCWKHFGSLHYIATLVDCVFLCNKVGRHLVTHNYTLLILKEKKINISLCILILYIISSSSVLRLMHLISY